MRNKVFYNKPEAACYGCHACKAICPVNAITMQSDEEGFLFPHIDSAKCIECNACEKTCPTQESVITPLFYETPTKVDAAWDKNETTRLDSTSGGVFSELARTIINKGGIIYGAAFDSVLKVRHIAIHSIEELYLLRGSKYVQSDIDNVFEKIRSELKEGKKVLFSGTPCQVGGLRAFLKKDYENLFTIDLVCHGVPSPSVFASHIKYIEEKYQSKVTDYKFRAKKRSGWRAYIMYIFEDGKKITNILGDDFYAQCFYRSLFNRKSCFTCEYSKGQRVGDITLSDFWGSENYSSVLKRQRKHGYNMVMCNTPKGEAWYKDVKSNVDNVTLSAEVAIKGDVRLRHTEKMPQQREVMFRDYRNHGYDWLVKNKSFKRSWKSRLIPTRIKNIIRELKSFT